MPRPQREPVPTERPREALDVVARRYVTRARLVVVGDPQKIDRTLCSSM